MEVSNCVQGCGSGYLPFHLNYCDELVFQQCQQCDGGKCVQGCGSGYLPSHVTGRGSSIGSEFAWHASGPEFYPHVRHILSWRLGHENISTAILPLPLIQEEQLSVTGKRMCTKYW